jgi:hypothetical protein
MTMTDTARLDAIGEHGLCIAQHQNLTVTGWEITWVVVYGDDKLVMSSDIREAIDAAVLDLTTTAINPH